MIIAKSLLFDQQKIALAIRNRYNWKFNTITTIFEGEEALKLINLTLLQEIVDKQSTPTSLFTSTSMNNSSHMKSNNSETSKEEGNLLKILEGKIVLFF